VEQRTAEEPSTQVDEPVGRDRFAELPALHGELIEVVVLVVIGVALIALAPARERAA
jgi:hypothetical protein